MIEIFYVNYFYCRLFSKKFSKIFLNFFQKSNVIVATKLDDGLVGLSSACVDKFDLLPLIDSVSINYFIAYYVLWLLGLKIGKVGVVKIRAKKQSIFFL